MIDIKLYDQNLNIINNLDLGDLEVGSSSSVKFYLKNDGDNDITCKIYIKPEVSFQNFTDIPCILDVYIINLFLPVFNNYYEILFREKNIFRDIANFPERDFLVIRDYDGYYRGIPNLAILFGSTNKNANARIYISDFYNMAGISLDNNLFKSVIDLGIIHKGDIVPFWFKCKLIEDLVGEKNPRKLNILIKGDEILA